MYVLVQRIVTRPSLPPALNSTHFYGRHLVIEWAKEEASVEALRAQTAKHYVEDGNAGPSAKKRKVELPSAD